jgi:hypothetical protein
LSRLHKYLQQNNHLHQPVDSAYLVGLAAHVNGYLAETADQPVNDVPLLPTDTHRDQPNRSINTHKALSVAISPAVIIERHRARQAVLDYYDLPSFPPNTWRQDEYLAGVTIARSNNLRRARIVDFLDRLVTADSSLLSGLVTLAPIKPEFTA